MPVYEIELKYYPTVLFTTEDVTERYTQAYNTLTDEQLKEYESILLRDVKMQHPYYDFY